MTQKEPAKPAKGTQGSVQEQVADSSNVPAGTASIHQVAVVRNRFVYRALHAIIWLTAAGVIIKLLLRPQYINAMLTKYRLSEADVPWMNSGFFMYVTGILAAGLSLVVFQVLTHRVPLVFTTLWKRHIIASPPLALPDASTPNVATSSPSPAQPLSSASQVQYQAFLGKFEALLNHPGQWAMGGIITLLVLTWYPDPVGEFVFWKNFMPDWPWVALTGISFGCLIQFLLAFMIGLLIWRMIILGMHIWRLGSVFRINPQLGHPDACGGLEPLGNLCLWNILIIGIAGIYLGGWIIPSQIPDVEETDPLCSWVQQSQSFSDIFLKLLLIPIVVSVLGFFVPLWSIHKAMLAKYSVVKQEMEQLTRSITEIEQTLLEQAGTLSPQETDDMDKRLRMIREVYERNRRYPVWPFNLGTLAKFASSQAVPLLVALGLSDNIAKVIQGALALVTRNPPPG